MPIKVHEAQLYLGLLGDAEFLEPEPEQDTPLSPQQQREEYANDQKMNKNRDREQRNERQMADAKIYHQRRTVEKAEKKDEEFEKHYQNLMENKHGWMTDLENDMQEHNARQRRKREMLHAQWLDKVFNPIQDQVINGLNNLNADIVSYRKKQSKLAVRPNPLAKSSRPIPPQERPENLKVKYSIKKIQDPLKPRKQFALPSVNSPLPPPSPDAASSRLQADEWLYYSRVYGRWDRKHAEYAEQAPVIDPSHVASGAVQADHYGFATGEEATKVLRKEFGSSKKIVGPLHCGIADRHEHQTGKRVVAQGSTVGLLA